MQDCKIIKNNLSDYVILTSKNPTSFEKIAAERFNKLLLESALVTLKVVSEGEFANGKYISIGNTKALSESGIRADFGMDGIAIIEKDGNLYLFGESVSGTIWATNVFFEQVAGYRFYADDEYKIEKVKDIDISGFNYVYTPTIAHRTSGFGICMAKDLEYATCLNTYAGFGIRADGTPFWGCWDNVIMTCHNHLTILPLSKYYDAHPEWYNDKKNELCLTNTEMREEFFKNFIEYVKEHYQTQTHFILGHEDNEDVCHCEKCQERINAVGCGGYHMEFTNYIARRTEEWRKANCPDREIYVGMFAYVLNGSLTPPVKEENGKVLPISDSVIAEPNVFVMFAPIAQRDHSRPITAPENAYFYRCFEKWFTVCKRISVWMYYASYRRSFEFTDGLYVIKDNINTLKKLGCEYYYVGVNFAKNCIVLQKMHLYVYAKLQWNANQDTDELINDFMVNYYKSAACSMRKFFDYLNAYYEKTRNRIYKLTGKPFYYGMCGEDTVPVGFWELNAIYDLTLILEQADKDIEKSHLTKEQKQTLKDRVEIEKLFLLYIQLEYFVREMDAYEEARTINTFSKERALEMLKQFKDGVKKFNVTCVDGDGTVDDTIKKWEREINWTARGWENRIKKSRELLDKLEEQEKL